jgi:putative endonuclease
MSDILSIAGEARVEISSRTKKLGEIGEELAADHLTEQGYRLVLSNFKVPIGRNSKGVQVTGEIDIIALDGETLCFVEVKTRRSDEFTPITANVDLRKQRQITRTAKMYRRLFNVYDMPHRFDVVTVLMPKYAEPTVDLLKGFWSEAKFRKRQWSEQHWQEYR